MPKKGTSKKAATPRQRQLMAWMAQFEAVHGLPPTIREVADQFELSPQTVHEALRSLESKGLLRRADRGSRAWTSARRPGAEARPTTVPLVGVIAAGIPIEAVEDRTDEVPVSKSLLRGRRGYALKVRGDSMVGAGILDGDVVVIRQQEDANDGDVVVALIGDDATLKRLYREGDRIRLEPANPEHPTVRVPADDLRIQGVVVGVQRTLDTE